MRSPNQINSLNGKNPDSLMHTGPGVGVVESCRHLVSPASWYDRH